MGCQFIIVMWWKSTTNDDLSTWLQLIVERSPLWWNFIIVIEIYYFYYENFSKYWISIIEIRFRYDENGSCWWKLIDVTNILQWDDNSWLTQSHKCDENVSLGCQFITSVMMIYQLDYNSLMKVYHSDETLSL